MSSTLKVDILQDSGGNTILSSDGSGTVTQTRTGILEADAWRITSNYSYTSGNEILNSNWERADTDTDKIGTGMTESSGTFSFPRTGIYLISYSTSAFDSSGTGESDYMGGVLYVTTDNSTYNIRANGYGNSSASGSYAHATINFMFDVTDISTHKARFYVQAQNACTFEGSSSIDKTSVKFIRLGDT